MGAGDRVGLVRNVTIVDTEKGALAGRYDIRIDGHRITEVGERLPARAGASVDGDDLYAIPGLIDGHIHALGFLYGEVPGPLDMPWVLRQQRRNLRALIRSGITTARDMCAPLRMVRWMSRRLSRHEIEGPRLLYAGPMLSVPGGYPHYLDPVPLPLRLIIGPLREDLTSPDHARRSVEAIAAAGACCIKVAYQSEGYDDARTPLPALTRPLLHAIAEEADRLRLPVAMHQVYLKDLRALEGLPFQSLEHTPIDALMTDADVAAFAARGIPASSTLAAYGLYDYVPWLVDLVEREGWRFEERPRRFLRASYAAMARGEVPHDLFGDDLVKTGARFMRQNLRRLAEAGVPIVFGTDTGSAVGIPGCPILEMREMLRAGFTRAEVLASATHGAAAAIGCPDLGRIAPGARADLVLLRQNPLEDLEAITEVAMVIRDGLEMHRAATLEPARVAA